MKNGVTSFEPLQCIEAFYTGSSVLWSNDGKTVFTVFGNVIKTISIDSGLPGFTIGDADSQANVTCAVLHETQESVSITVAYANGLICRYTLHVSKDGTDPIVTMNRRWKSTHNGPITVMKYFDDGNLLATGSPDFSTRVWKIDTQNCIACFKGSSAVSALLFVDLDRLLIGYSDGSVHLYTSNESNKRLHEWKLHSSQIVTILLSNKEKAFFLSRDQTVSSVSLETYEKLKVIPIFEPVECGLLLDCDLYTVGEEGVLKRWTNDGAKLISSKKISSCRIDMILYNKNRSQFLLVSSDYNLYLVNAESLIVTGQYVGFNDEIFDISFVGEDEKNLVVAANSPEIRFYNTSTWCCQLIHGHSDSVLSVTTAKWDNDLFASSSKDNSIILWKILPDSSEVKQVKILGIATGHTNSVTCVKFSKMAKTKFLVSVSHDLTLKLWPLPEFSSDDCVKLTTSSTLVAHSKEITSLDVSLNDRLCVTGSMDKCAKLWHIDSATMQLGFAGTLSGHRRGVWDVRFSEGTQVVGTCCGDCCVRVYSVTSLDCIATLSGHSFAVLQMTFVNNGKQLISADGGGLLKIWNVNDKDCVSTIEAHDDKIWTLVPSKNESRLVTAGSDGRIRIWKDVTEQKLEEQEAIAVKKVQNEQKLSNLIEQKRFSEALSFTLTFEKPYNCYNVLVKLLDENSDELYNSIAKMDDDQLISLLDFITKWNTNSSTALVLFTTLVLVN
uniref:WD_REPEATS_REGION domain-containing protein n=1 Tax=Syphacia muris TaxID=451379 RepID=A0A0N5ATD2_9BILA